MEKTEACAILRVPIEVSRIEVETAFRKRMREVRARFEAARGMSLRAQCQREFAAIRDAQDCLLSESVASVREEPTFDEPPVYEPLADESMANDGQLDEQRVAIAQVREPGILDPPVSTAQGDEPPVEEAQAPGPTIHESRVSDAQREEPRVEKVQVHEPGIDEPRVDEAHRDEPRVQDAQKDEPGAHEPQVDESQVDELPTEAPAALEHPVTPPGGDPTGKSPPPTASVPDQLRPGQLFLSRFELWRELEIGSAGEVWLAQDHVSQRQVALIFLSGLIMSDKAEIDNLRNEIRRRTALNHSNILHIFDLVEDKGRIAIEIESPKGRSLSELRFGRPNHVFEVGDLQTWVTQLCEALQYAHVEAGLIHGNIQPANLIIDAAGSLKVKDFGISNFLSESISRLTRTPKTSEALQYKSPQQAAGETAAVGDDVYSLGATLYESLTSKPPFSAREIALQLSAKKPPSMTERRAVLGIQGGNIPKNWEETVAACLATDPSQRPQSAIEVARRLENAVPPLGIPTPAPPPPPPRPPVKLGTQTNAKLASSAPPLPSRKRWLVFAGILFILVIVSAIAFLVFQFLTEPKPGKLVVKTNPRNANVFIDGVDRGTTPLVLEDLAPGDRRLRIELKGYRKEELIVPIKRGAPEGSLLIHLVPIIRPSPTSTVTPSPSESIKKDSSPSLPTPSPEGNLTPPANRSQTPSSEKRATASSQASAIASPEANETESPEASETTSPQKGVSPNEGQSPSLTPTPLSPLEIAATKKDVIKRINALPNISNAAKERLIEKLDRARSMERLTIIPFDIGRTVLRRGTGDELVQAFDSLAMRDKLSDPTIVLVVAGYADTGGRADLNLRISQERAEHVTKILKERANLLNAMQTIGMGGTELLDSNRPDQNRAVEVWAVLPY
jgi:serine/threonine protein kinase